MSSKRPLKNVDVEVLHTLEYSKCGRIHWRLSKVAERHVVAPLAGARLPIDMRCPEEVRG